MMGVKLLSGVDPQKVQINAGKHFSTCKSCRKTEKVISISRDYSKAFWALFNLYLVRNIGVPKLKIW